MSVSSPAAPDEVRGGPTRQEALAAAAEVTALFLIFIVAFTGREHFSERVKDVLTALSVAIGLAGAGAGAVIVRRGLMSRLGRYGRIALGGFMAFAGIYTIIHVLS